LYNSFSTPLIRFLVFLVPCITYLADLSEYRSYDLAIAADRRIPDIIFLAVSAILLLVQVTRVGGSPYQVVGGGINITPIFTIVSLILNGILSGSIVLRLLFFRWRIQKDLGPAAGRQYISIAAMLIESAMLYMAVWIPSLVPTFLQSPFQNVFTPACIHVQV
jgi:hypothetical protein